MSRGYACIALDNPKDAINVGSTLRAAQCYDAKLVVVANPRCPIRAPTDTMKGARHIPTIRVEDVFDALPFDCVPVAVELVTGARPLSTYVHPERAFYIFGGEDQTLGARITDRCRDVIYVPTNGCMNLAATVNVVLYDRLAKRSHNRTPAHP